MRKGLYAGTFDPWTDGHKFVLESALEVFDCIHIVPARNPAKQSAFKSEERARVIAHSIDPFQDWWTMDSPFLVGDRVIVTPQDGLIADYAQSQGITHLIRGLRSTTDFESEFNLYFANQAINPSLQTWAIMCPPRLLHCSSTYVKTVVGKPNVRFVGTTFVSQALMLKHSRIIGRLFDLIEASSLFRFDVDSLNLGVSDLRECLQLLFSSICQKILYVTRNTQIKSSQFLDVFLSKQASLLSQKYVYHASYVHELWAILAFCIGHEVAFLDGYANGVVFLEAMAKRLGKTDVPLFDRQEVLSFFQKFF